ncbi:MAG: DUF2093 domain-containing protein [Pseudomonadota bacterium]
MLMGEREAKLFYTISSFRVVQPGDYVICAVTGKRIALQNLRYWNADRQEAYIDGPTSTARHDELAGK